MLSMSHSNYHQTLKQLWQKSVDRCVKGDHAKENWFDTSEKEFLASIGCTVQEIFDFADDFTRHGEPDETTFLLLANLRRHYFLNQQNGVPSTHVVEMADLPPKDEAVDGVRWLPRLIRKAHAKLRGEMNPDLMYGCGGDRGFFRDHNIHVAEFLQVVLEHEHDDRAVIDWVLARKKNV